MRLLDLFEHSTGGELPKYDPAIRASGHNNVLLRPLVELEAKNGCCVAKKWLVYQALSVEVPNSDTSVSAPADQIFARILNGVYTLCMRLIWMVGVRQLEICEATSIPIVLKSPFLLVEVLPVDLGFKAR
jgi:hypothetical protein